MDILGFFFLGLAALCVAPLMGRGRVESAIRWLFFAFGVESIIGLLAHAFDKQLILLSYNAAMTLTIFIASILLTVYFGRGRGTRSKV